jgi:hypothetical protein
MTHKRYIMFYTRGGETNTKQIVIIQKESPLQVIPESQWQSGVEHAPLHLDGTSLTLLE